MMTVLLIILAIVALYLFFLAPSPVRRSEVAAMRPFFYAHRGLHDNATDAPENSLLAFQKAVDGGYGIELDVQLTRDGQVVVFHDNSLKRVCGVEGKISDFSYEELCQIPLFQTKSHIPLFTDVLAIVNGKTPLIVELKIVGNDLAVCPATNEILSNYKGLYCVESFHPMAVRWYRQHRPDVMRGQLSCAFTQRGIAFRAVEHLLSNVLTRPHFIAYDHAGRKNLSRRICRSLFRCFSVTWTVKSQDELNICRKDFDIFIFEGFIPN